MMCFVLKHAYPQKKILWVFTNYSKILAHALDRHFLPWANKIPEHMSQKQS